MGRSVKKKTPKQFKFEFNKGYVDSIDACLDILDRRLDKLESIINSNSTPNLIQDLCTEFVSLNTSIKSLNDTRIKLAERVTALEQLTKPVIVNTTNISANLLDALKKSHIKPDIKVTPAQPAPTSENYNPWQPSSHPMLEKARCENVFTSVRNALRLMRGISYFQSETCFHIEINRQHYTQLEVNFTRNNIIIKYNDKNGKMREEHHYHVLPAATSVVAICMYYATR